MHRKSHYPAADIPDIAKTQLAKLYRALHKKGLSRADFLDAMEETDWSVSASQLDRWALRLDSVGTAILNDKRTGALPSLDREQRDVMSGWVLHENEHGKEVNL